MFFSFISCN